MIRAFDECAFIDGRSSALAAASVGKPGFIEHPRAADAAALEKIAARMEADASRLARILGTKSPVVLAAVNVWTAVRSELFAVEQEISGS